MKYISIALVFLSLTFFALPQRAHAGSAVAGALEPTQILNNIQLLIGNSTTYTDMINQYMETVKDVFTNPIASALIAAAQQQAAIDITNWATGGFQGNSTIIANPERYIKNKGLEAVRAQLGNIPTNSAYGDSILASVIDNFRSQSDLAGQLKNLSQSQIPSMLQSRVCDEAGLNTLVSSEGLTMGTPAFTARKSELYNTLCQGDPTTDQQLAQTLMQVQDQRPEAGGLDVLLARTIENPYTASTKSIAANEKKKYEEEQAAKAALDQGNGQSNQENCKTYAMADPNGNTYPDGTAPCVEYEVVTPSGLVSDATSKSLTAGLDRLTNLQVDGFNGLLASFATEILKPTLQRAFTSAAQTATEQFFGTAPQIGKAGTSVNTSYSTIITKVYSPNLANDPDTKAAIIAPIMKLLKAHLASLNDLAAIDDQYSAQLDTYEAAIKNTQTCYDSLAQSNPSSVNDPQVISANDILKDRQVKIDTARQIIQSDTTNIDITNTLITTTIDKINASNSSQEINDLFKNYQNQIDAKNLPTVTSAAERQGTFEKQKASIGNETGPGGTITGLMSQCRTMSIQFLNIGNDFWGSTGQ